MGRFLSPDPIGPWGDETNWGNAYAYGGNNPLSGWDPTGMGWFNRMRGFIKSAAKAVTNVAIGAFSGAVTGAATGATTGAAVGAVVGAVGGAGVGAAPGALAGATAGATAGAISGAIGGAFSAIGNMIARGRVEIDVEASAKSGAIGGAIAGGISGAFAGVGAGVGAGGTQPLTHFTNPEAAANITATQQLGVSASSNLFATTGTQAGTTVAGATGVPIGTATSTAFTAVPAVGPLTAYASAAGFQSAGSGVLSLSTGTFVAGCGINTTVATAMTIDLTANAVVGFSADVTTSNPKGSNPPPPVKASEDRSEED